MKHYLFALFITLGANAAQGGNPTPERHIDGGSFLKRNITIDMFDTVVFDISQSAIAFNQVTFPVYLSSDDTINALDFSLQFDEANFSLDTIINLTTYLQPVYNISQGTLYLTSYSLQEIEHNIPLLSIRLNMLGHYLCSQDLDSALAYLNGDQCSVKVMDCLDDNIDKETASNNFLSVFPNPASDIINIETAENATVQVLDMNDPGILVQCYTEGKSVQQIKIGNLPSGIYTVRAFNKNFVAVKKVVIEK